MGKVVAIMSGGIDSVTMVCQLIKTGYEVNALTFNYGQRHDIEITRAKKIAKKLGINHKVVNIKSINELIRKGSLSGDESIPEGHYSDESQKSTIVPNRNMIMLSLATGWAVTIGAKYVDYAAHTNDKTIYPDCRPEFVAAMKEAIFKSTEGAVILRAPFISLTKADVVQLGKNLNAPLELTWSCYNPQNGRPCLKCGTCIERTEAFVKNDLKDPALTGKEWEEAVDVLNQYTK
jgi:7-cyano-7-deazaguanine synthase